MSWKILHKELVSLELEKISYINDEYHIRIFPSPTQRSINIIQWSQ